VAETLKLVVKKCWVISPIILAWYFPTTEEITHVAEIFFPARSELTLLELRNVHYSFELSSAAPYTG